MRFPDASSGPFTPEMAATESLLNQDRIRQEMHAVNVNTTSSISSDGIVAWASFNATQDFVKSAVTEIVQLLGEGVPTLIYTGHFDNCMNPLSTANWMAKVNSWQYKEAGAEDGGTLGGRGRERGARGRNYSMSSLLNLPRVPFKMEGITVGNVRSQGGFYNAIVFRAGHMTTLEQPNVTKHLYLDFISGSLARLHRPS